MALSRSPVCPSFLQVSASQSETRDRSCLLTPTPNAGRPTTTRPQGLTSRVASSFFFDSRFPSSAWAGGWTGFLSFFCRASAPEFGPAAIATVLLWLVGSSPWMMIQMLLWKLVQCARARGPTGMPIAGVYGRDRRATRPAVSSLWAASARPASN
jgi:hypothetical protein